MSAALVTHADLSTSNGTHPDFSLSSLHSTPVRGLRVPSASSRTTAQSSSQVATPSPPSLSTFSRRKGLDEGPSLSARMSFLNQDDRGEDGDGDLLDTPGGEKKQWGDRSDSPSGTRAKRARPGAAAGKGVTLTLRDQEKVGIYNMYSRLTLTRILQHIDNLKKENFNIKLRVHFLEERLAQLAPDQIDAALKQNINLKIEVQQRGMEMKKLKKLVLSLEHELERLQRGAGGSRGRERELEEKLDEREWELQELRRRRSGHGDDDEALREAEARNAELEEDLENARGLLEDNMDEIERLKEIVERRGDDSVNDGVNGESRRDRLKRRVEELEAENEELRLKLDDHGELLSHKEDEKEDLADELDALRLEMEDLQRRREAESAERSQSRVQILEEREEREAVEDDLNAMRDKLAAAMIELQQKEEEIDQKNKEIDDLVSEHQRIVEVVEDEWRGEVEEARGQVEELRDVCIFSLSSVALANALLLQVLAERESESKDLRVNISELEANTNDLHAKFETAFAQLEQESDQKDEEIESMQETIDKLGEQIYHLEDENDRLKEESDRLREEEAAERDRLEALAAALKEVCSLQLTVSLHDYECLLAENS
jgi:predicted  nucleic acid-binding Zn-ribbon protein